MSNAGGTSQQLGVSLQPYLLWALAAAIIFWLYYPILHYGFRGEEFQILYFVKYNFNLYHSFITRFLFPVEHANSFYRPIPREFSYYIITSLFGFKPLAFRIILFLLFFATIFLVYTLSKLCTGNKAAAFLSAAFFASRGCHFDLMYWILFGFENLIAGAFIFSAVLAHIFFLRNAKKRYLLICCTLTLLALSTKESAIVLPLYMGMTYLFFKKYSFKGLMLSVLPAAGITAVFAVRILLIGGNMSGTVYQMVFSPYALVKNTGWYIYRCFNSPVELSLCAAAVFFSFVMYRSGKAVLFGAAWFFVSLIPFAAFQRTNEGYLFIPMFGISIIIAKSIQPLLEKIPVNRSLLLGLICFLFVMAGGKNLRAQDTVWQPTEHFVNNVLSYYNSAFYSFPDDTLVYIKDKNLPYWKTWILGQGKAFMMNHKNLSVYFECWRKKAPHRHYSTVYYFSLADDSIKFLGKHRH